MSDNLLITVGQRSPEFSNKRWYASGKSVLGSMLSTVFAPVSAMVKGGREFLLAIAILNIPLQIGAHPFYDDDLAAQGALGGLDLSVTVLALAALYVMWLVEFLLNRVSRPPVPRLTWSVVLYGVAAALSLGVAKDVKLGSFQLFVIVEGLLLFVYLASWVRTREDVDFVLRFLFLGLILESLLMMYLSASGQESFKFAGMKASVVDQDPYSSPSALGLPRVGGTVGSPNGCAGYIAMLLAPAISVLFTKYRQSLKSLALLAFFMGGIALVLTFSRGGWLASFISVTLLFGFAARRIRIPRKILFTGVALILVAGVIFKSAISDRLTNSDQGAAESRIPLMHTALEMIADNPILGVGVNNYPLRMQEYATPDVQWLYTVHNKYLLDWAEMGIGGLFALVWFLVSVIRRGLQSWKSGDPFLSPIAMGLTAAMIGTVLHMMVELYRDALVVWVGAALIMAIWHQTQMKLPQHSALGIQNTGRP